MVNYLVNENHEQYNILEVDGAKQLFEDKQSSVIGETYELFYSIMAKHNHPVSKQNGRDGSVFGTNGTISRVQNLNICLEIRNLMC